MATGDTPPRIPSRDRDQTRREGIPHVRTGQQNPGPHAGSQAATSRKSVAENPTRMLRKSGRQQPAEPYVERAEIGVEPVEIPVVHHRLLLAQPRVRPAGGLVGALPGPPD